MASKRELDFKAKEKAVNKAKDLLYEIGGLRQRLGEGEDHPDDNLDDRKVYVKYGYNEVEDEDIKEAVAGLVEAKFRKKLEEKMFEFMQMVIK